MDSEKRNRFIKAFAELASEYKDCIVKNSGTVSAHTDTHPSLTRTEITFSLEFVKQINNEKEDVQNKEAYDFYFLFSDMCEELQKYIN